MIGMSKSMNTDKISKERSINKPNKGAYTEKLVAVFGSGWLW